MQIEFYEGILQRKDLMKGCLKVSHRELNTWRAMRRRSIDGLLWREYFVGERKFFEYLEGVL